MKDYYNNCERYSNLTLCNDYNNMKLKTIRYYTKGKYTGWEKITTFEKQYLSLKSWILSGNDLRVGNKLINVIEYIKNIFKEDK